MYVLKNSLVRRTSHFQCDISLGQDKRPIYHNIYIFRQHIYSIFFQILYIRASPKKYLYVWISLSYSLYNLLDARQILATQRLTAQYTKTSRDVIDRYRFNNFIDYVIKFSFYSAIKIPSIFIMTAFTMIWTTLTPVRNTYACVTIYYVIVFNCRISHNITSQYEAPFPLFPQFFLDSRSCFQYP